MTKILVYYYIQSDPWESLKEPNVYALEKKYNHAGEVTVKDTYDSFPIKNQKYYLRYYLDDSKQNIKGWLDLPPSAKAPVYNDKIYIKAIRLPQDVSLTFKNDLFKKKTTSDSSIPKNTTTPINNYTNHNSIINNNDPSVKSTQSKSPNKVLINNNGNTNTNNINNTGKQSIIPNQKFNSQGGQKEIINMQNVQNNLLNLENEIKFEEIKKKEDPFNINNLDLDSIVFHEENKVSNNNKNNNEEDKFGLFNNISGNTNPDKNSPNKQPSVKSEFDLGSLGLDFTSTTNTTNNVNTTSTNNVNTNTNENKNENVNFPKEDKFFELPPLQVDPNSLDNFAIREICDPIINLWVRGDGFEKKNIRMLLSTLHEIWKGDNWIKLSLGDVLEDNKLKKAYQRCILQIHPDKIHSPDPRMKYCAERVCNIITEAFSESKK